MCFLLDSRNTTPCNLHKISAFDAEIYQLKHINSARTYVLYVSVYVWYHDSFFTSVVVRIACSNTMYKG